jgi:hypothetical protein
MAVVSWTRGKLGRRPAFSSRSEILAVLVYLHQTSE